MKKIVIIGLLAIGVSSCQAPQDDRATSLCNCYKELHKVNPETNADLLNYIADSCKTLHIGILKEIERNEEDKAKFNEAYEFCQNEK